MTVFDSTTSQTQGNESTPKETTEDWVSLIVKEKGDQWSDPQALAKGYIHAQDRIKELEQFEAKAKEQDYAKALLDRLQAQAPTSTSGNLEEPSTKGSSEEGNTTTNPEDIQSLIERSLSEREAKAISERNIKLTNDYLESTFGEAAEARVNEAAQRLGMTKDALRSIAEKSPEAFKTLVTKGEKQDNRTVTSTVNTTDFNSNSSERNQAFYSKLRRENKSLYYSADIQRQMFDDRVRLGDKW